MKAYIWFSVLSAVLVLAGCGTSTISNSAGSESVSEIALASGSGAVNGSEGNGARFEEVLRTSNCPTLANSIGSCSGGSVTLTYSGCQFSNGKGGLLGGSWNGAQDIAFTLGGSASCPSGMGQIVTSDYTMARTFASGTTRTGAAGVTVTINTTNPTGWDSNVSLGSGPYGEAIAFNGTQGARTINLIGVEYTASITGATKSVWDHTLNTPTPLTLSIASGVKTVNGTIQVQHNLMKATFQAIFSNVTYDPGNCGCNPTGGTITTTCVRDNNGNVCSKFGTETLTISAPASGQSCSSGFNLSSTGSLTTGIGAHVFNHCF